jgi:hypothetical protein
MSSDGYDDGIDVFNEDDIDMDQDAPNESDGVDGQALPDEDEDDLEDDEVADGGLGLDLGGADDDEEGGEARCNDFIGHS